MRIAIADPQMRVRFSLHILLEQQGWAIAGEAADCFELFEFLRIDTPDLLLVDLNLPGIPSGNLLRLLRTEHPAMRIIAMSGKQELGRLAVAWGADYFACKADSPEKLLTLIRELQDREGDYHANSGSE